LSQPFNILITSAGRRVNLIEDFRQSLQELGLEGSVYATDLGPLAAAWHAADGAFHSRRFNDPAYMADLLEQCQQRGVKLVIPTIDTELPLYAEHRRQFADAGITLAVSGPEAIHIGGDKVRTHDWLTTHGFPAPRQTDAAGILADPDAWPMPMIAKPRAGSSSIGLVRVESLDAVRQIADREGLIFQTLATGAEYTIDVFIDHAGTPHCAVPRMRLETRGGEISKGVTVRDPKLQQLALDLCGKLPEPRGVMCVQVFVDPDTGDMKVIEFNPRFGGGYPLTQKAGANFTRWLIEDALGLPLSATPDDWQDGLVMLRHDRAVYISRDDAGLGPHRPLDEAAGT